MIADTPERQRATRDPIAAASVRGRRKAKPSCADCFFGKRMLCALELDQPCSTFRPDGPDGLLPPTQPTLPLGEPGVDHRVTLNAG